MKHCDMIKYMAAHVIMCGVCGAAHSPGWAVFSGVMAGVCALYVWSEELA